MGRPCPELFRDGMPEERRCVVPVDAMESARVEAFLSLLGVKHHIGLLTRSLLKE